MTAQKSASAKQDFANAIMRTFGKLDAGKIRTIDGSSEHLVVQLMESYGWDRAAAQAKVDQFLKRISFKPL